MHVTSLTCFLVFDMEIDNINDMKKLLIIFLKNVHTFVYCVSVGFQQEKMRSVLQQNTGKTKIYCWISIKLYCWISIGL